MKEMPELIIRNAVRRIVHMALDKVPVESCRDVIDLACRKFASAEEIFYIFRELGGLWLFNYNAPDASVILHAELKSGRHSDGFLNAKVVLENPVILEFFARQIAKAIEERSFTGKPDMVAGIPTGATNLGRRVAEIFGVECLEMVKESDGAIRPVGEIVLDPVAAHETQKAKTLILVEDFTTRGTGFIQAVQGIRQAYGENVFVKYFEFVIINRGGLETIEVPIEGSDQPLQFLIMPLAERRIQDWAPEECLPCSMGSEAIKPKAAPGNWERLVSGMAA